MTTECWICESRAILQIGSFRHLRRFLACYCLLPSYFGAWTPRLLREPNSATRWFGFLHFITSGGSSSGSGSEEPLVRWFAIPVRARRESSNRYLPSIFVDVPVIRICSGGYLAVHCSVSVCQWERRRYSEVINCYVDSVSIRSMWNTTRGHPCSRGCAAAVVELKAMTRECRASTSRCTRTTSAILWQPGAPPLLAQPSCELPKSA